MLCFPTHKLRVCQHCISLPLILPTDFTESPNYQGWTGPLDIIWSSAPVEAEWPRAGHTGTRPGGFGTSLERETPRTLGNLFQCSAALNAKPFLVVPITKKARPYSAFCLPSRRLLRPSRHGKPTEPSEGGCRTSLGPGPRPTALPPHPAGAPGRGAAGAERERPSLPRSPRHTNSTDFDSPAAIFAQRTSRLSHRPRLALRHRQL